jgi:anti-anti-sigma factor
MVLVVGADDDARRLRSAIMASLTGPAHDLVIDLTALRSMGNDGLAVLVSARARQRARHQVMSLIYGRHSATDRALSRAGLRGAFPPQRR